jgi:hypothetical protein
MLPGKRGDPGRTAQDNRRFILKTAVDGRKTHQVAVATEQFERRSITGLELLRSRGNCPESRANTRSALFGSNDNCGFQVH